MPVMYSLYCFIPCVADPSWSLASGLSTRPPGPISLQASPLHGIGDIIMLTCMLLLVQPCRCPCIAFGASVHSRNGYPIGLDLVPLWVSW